MKINKIEENEIWQVYNTWLTAYLNADVKTYGTYLDEDYHFIGSTNNEEFLNRNDTKTFFERTGEQFSGIMDLRNEVKILEVFDRSIFITHFCDVWFLNDKDWAYYGRFRLSSVMLKKNEAWRFIYQHFSMPDSKSDEGETIGFDKVNAENIELKEAIKRRTIELESKNRELEVEGALERVRARSSAMQYSGELGQVIALIFNILDEFNISVKDGVALITFKEGSKDLNEWMANPGFDEAMNFHLPYFDHPVLSNLWQAKNRGEDFLIERYSAEESRSFLNQIFEHSDFKHTPQSVKEYCLAARTYATSIALQKHTAIFINDYSGISLTSSELDLLKRFSVVFEQTYTRFLDIQKAEAQAREAQIEVALERTRIQSMLMRHSDEIKSISNTFHEQLIQLKIPSEFSYVWLPDEAKKEHQFWASWSEIKNGEKVFESKQITYPLDKSEAYTQACYNAWAQPEVVLEEFIPPTEVAGFFDIWQELLTGAQKLKAEYFPEGIFYTEAYMKYGCFGINIRRKLSEEEKTVLKRFSIEFERAYTRFLDLKKAEAQAREAQIVASLERVRAATMAMHNSGELSMVLSKLFEQFDVLGIKPSHAVLTLIDKEKNTLSFRTTGKNGYQVIGEQEVDLTIVDAWLDTAEKWKKSEPNAVNINEYPPEVLPEVWEVYKDILASMPKKARPEIKDFPEGLFITEGYCKFGYIGFAHHRKPTAEEQDIVRRIAVEFGTLYQRFLDLQKAEAQAREAQIETALEKVRSASMAMQKQGDLLEVINLLSEQLVKLGVQMETAYFSNGLQLGKRNLWIYTVTGDESAFTDYIHFPEVNHPIFIRSEECIQDFKNGKADFFKDVYDKEEKDKWLDYTLTKTVYKDLSSEAKDYLYNKPGFTRSTIFFKDTSVGIGRYNTIPFSDEEDELLKRFANAFNLAYTRFLDLQKAEAQSKENQIQLALERVRARTMAMQKSEELSETASVLFQQFIQLGYETERINIGIIKEDQHFIEFWSTEQGGNAISQVFKGSIDEPTSIKKFYEAWVNKEESIEVCLEGEELKKWMYYVIDVLKIPTQESLISDRRFHTCAYFSNGLLISTNPKPLLPETLEILKRFAKVFEQTYTRFQDLQKAEEQAREVQIEAALERVRSRTMAMQKSDELAETAAILFQQLIQLGIEPNRLYIGIIKDNSSIAEFWTTEEDGTKIGTAYTTDLLGNTSFKKMYDAWSRKEKSTVVDIHGEELSEYIEHLSSLHIPFKDGIKQIRRIQHLAYFAKGFIGMASSDEQPKESMEILERFAYAFNLTFTRFNDLQKAEEQAREAQIEAALERIRSRSMAMHKTSELSEVIIELFKQFELLNLVVDTCYIDIFDQNNQGFNFWIGAGTAIYPKQVNLPYFDHPIHQLNRDARKNGIDFFIFDEDKKSKEKYFKHFYPNAKGIDVPEERKQHIANGKGITGSAALGKYSGITMFNYQKIIYSNEENDILIRVNKVFQQTYTRFLDLQKAEAQARDAQIEAALERVRSASMAMHSSDELEKVVEVTFRQLQSLRLPIDGCQLITFEDQSKNFHFWSATPEMIYPNRLNIPYFDHPIFLKFWEARDRGDTFTSIDLTRTETLDFYNHLYDKTNLGIAVTKERWEKIQSIEHGFKTSWGIQKNTGLWVFNFSNHQFTEEENSLIDRFAKVFEQTYTRFLDLQKAEAQAREAIKQSSLDRVRGEIASMRDAKDLERITPLVWKELQALGVPFFRCGVMLVNEEDEILDFYLSNPEGEALAALHLDYDNSDISRNGVAHWRKKKTYIEHWDKEQFLSFMKSLLDQGQISNAATYQGGEKPPSALTLQFVPFTQGMVYVGSESDLSKEELDLVKALGRSLSVAYARYEDFTKLDIAKAKAEKALTELKSAQEQLVQQEKLASLGQLTAGIAHEIKNPLNFVNNFSDLSRELIEEVFEELENISDSEAKEEIMAILNDVKSNLTKVHEHGTRANGIVTSMLQHSRASGSKREAKAFNPLVKEYVNLSFHGMRAGKAPINVDIDLQLDPKVGDVTLTSEDFSRVILNLCNNAFDAMRDKLKAEDGRRETENGNSYLPKLTVKTALQKGKVFLSITDNGGGIPDEIKDKILQPFFTTKKGTEGTGLGLSITNDIIKAHGGELNVGSQIGSGSHFIISLPTKSKKN